MLRRLFAQMFRSLRLRTVRRPVQPRPRENRKEETLRQQALVALRQRDIQGALRALSEALPQGQEAATHALHAHLLTVIGEMTEARQAADKAVAIDNTDRHALAASAAIAEHEGDINRALFIRMRLIRQSGLQVSATDLIATLKVLVQAASETARNLSADLEYLIVAFEQIEERVTATHAQEFAEALFTIKSKQLVAITLYQRYAPNTQLTALEWLPPESLHANGDFEHEGESGHATHTFENASIFPAIQWLPWLPERNAIVNGYLTRRLRTRREDPNSPLLLFANNQVIVAQDAQPPIEVPTTTVLVGGVENYYHFVLEHVSRLMAFDHRTINRMPVRWAVPANLLPYQSRLLELAGISDSQLIRIAPDRPHRFRRLIAPVPSAKGGKKFDPELATWFRTAISSRLPTRPSVKLYLSRKTANRRSLLNEQEVIRRLRERGFKCIVPELLDVSEQIAYFSSASVIVSPSGAALTNMVFMPPGGIVVVMHTRYVLTGPFSLHFDDLATACGHEYRSVECDVTAFRTSRAVDADFTVDIDQLLAQID